MTSSELIGTYTVPKEKCANILSKEAGEEEKVDIIFKVSLNRRVHKINSNSKKKWT